MIEGLKVTIPGTELVDLCNKRAVFHDDRAKFYESQKDALPDVDGGEIGGPSNFSNSGKTPADEMRARIKAHRADAMEMRFIAAHIDVSETYRLTREDLYRVGIVSRVY